MLSGLKIHVLNVSIFHRLQKMQFPPGWLWYPQLCSFPPHIRLLKSLSGNIGTWFVLSLKMEERDIFSIKSIHALDRGKENEGTRPRVRDLY